MRLPDAAHRSRPWRIHEIVPDFRLEDAWALPARGGAEDFERLVDRMVSSDPSESDAGPAKFLWDLRDRLGQWFGLGRISKVEAGGLAIPGTDEKSLRGRLADDLLGSADDVEFKALPFEAVYRTDHEFAAEISNATVHGVMHLGWFDLGDGHYCGEMAVYVKPRGVFGEAYMALIKPFRLWIVYPALMRQMEREWAEETAASGRARKVPLGTR